jgi:hypothetical protein
MSKEVKLGHKVRDLITGYEGIAYQELLLMSGTVQFAVQPPMTDDKKGEMPSGMNLDVHTLEYVDDGIFGRVIPPPADALVAVKLGEEVVDEVTGLKGMVMSRTTFANGCVYFTVQPPMVKGEVPEIAFLDWKRLKRVGKGISAKVSNVAPKEPTKSPGGPRSVAMRAC